MPILQAFVGVQNDTGVRLLSVRYGNKLGVKMKKALKGCLLIMISLGFSKGALGAQNTKDTKKVQFGLTPGFYKIKATTFLDGKPVDPYGGIKKYMSDASVEAKKEMAETVRRMNERQQCITPDMLKGDQFFRSLKGNKTCQFKMRKTSEKELLGYFKCPQGRGSGHVTARLLSGRKGYEMAYIGGKGPKGQKLKIVTQASFASKKCPKNWDHVRVVDVPASSPSKPQSPKSQR